MVESNLPKQKFGGRIYCTIHAPLFRTQHDLAKERSQRERGTVVSGVPSYLLTTAWGQTLSLTPLAFRARSCINLSHSGICEPDRRQISDATENTECRDAADLTHDDDLRGEAAVRFRYMLETARCTRWLPLAACQRYLFSSTSSSLHVFESPCSIEGVSSPSIRVFRMMYIDTRDNRRRDLRFLTSTNYKVTDNEQHK